MDGRNLIPIAHDGSAVGRKREREDSLIDRQIQYRTQIHCQQKSPIGSYAEMDIIVGLKCMPLIKKKNAYFISEVQKLYQRWSAGI